jgi:hypothetical protein
MLHVKFPKGVIGLVAERIFGESPIAIAFDGGKRRDVVRGEASTSPA